MKSEVNESKKIIMIGNGSLANTMMYYLKTTTNWEVVAYSSELISEKTTYNGKPFVPINSLVDEYSINEYEVINVVGYSNMCGHRKRLYEKIKAMGYRMPNYIHPSAILNNVTLGDSNIVLENVVFEPNAIIENNIIIWSAVLIGHDTFVGSHSYFAPCSLIAGNSKVGQNCFLGSHSTLIDGGELAEHTLLGAGAFCSNTTCPYDVIVPVRSIVLGNHKSIELI